MEYIITARGDYKGSHKTLTRAIEHAEKLAGNSDYEGDVQVRELISDSTPHHMLPVVWRPE